MDAFKYNIVNKRGNKMSEEKDSQQVIVPVTKEYGFSFDDVQFCIKNLKQTKVNIAYYTSLEGAIKKCVSLQTRSGSDMTEQDTTDLWALVDRYNSILSEVKQLAGQIVADLAKITPASPVLAKIDDGKEPSLDDLLNIGGSL